MTGPAPTLYTDSPVLHDFAAAVGDQKRVAVEGGRTRWHNGGPLEEDVELLRAPSGIVDYKPEEMTVGVLAGTKVAELHDLLASHGQRTALPERGGTVGGAIAVGESDHRALGRGLLRTALLQVRYVSAEGRIISSGGPTVKNVSGFDLPRLVVGSLGTLGLIAEVILRTNPIPPASKWLAVTDVEPGRVHAALLAPSAILWDGASTWVQLEGHEPDVESQIAVLRSISGANVSKAEGPPALGTYRWSLPPSELLALGSGSGHDTGRFVAAIGLGLVFAERPQPPRPLAAAVEVVSRRLKENFDPTGRLNPGRSPGRS